MKLVVFEFEGSCVHGSDSPKEVFDVIYNDTSRMTLGRVTSDTNFGHHETQFTATSCHEYLKSSLLLRNFI